MKPKKPPKEIVSTLGRPKDASKREDIVRAASNLFMNKGYELTSMEAVAQKANVSKLTIYSHFADKDELFKEVIRARCDKLAMPESYLMLAHEPVELALLKLASNFTELAFSPDSIRLNRIMQGEGQRHPRVVEIFYEAGPKRVKSAFADLLKAWVKEGALAIPDVTKATQQFFSLLKGEMLSKIILCRAPLPTKRELNQHVKATVAFFLAAYQTKKSSKNLSIYGNKMRTRKSKLTVALLILILAIIGVGSYVYIHRGEESTDDAALDGRTVAISAKIPGYVKELNINDNQVVKAGDVLLEIDPTDYIIRRDKATAVLEAAKAAASASEKNLETTNISAPSNLDAAEAQVASAEATYDKALSDLKRMQRLSNEARSQEQLDQAVATEKAANSNLMDAKAKLRSAETAPKTIAEAQANSDQLAAEVKQAEADLAQAENDLANTKITASMDGRITKRGVEKGDYIQPGQQLGSLVGTEIWVTANFKETQLKNIKPGQRVTIEVDALSNKKLEGRVDSIQAGTGARFSAFPPENATGNFVKIVQRVPVKITLDAAPDPALALGPGMSVVPTVYTEDP